MSLHDLIHELDKIACQDECYDPEVYIQVGDFQAPICGVAYFPEDMFTGEAVVIGDSEKPKLYL